MQDVEFNPNETMTRKEYLKRKKRQNRKGKFHVSKTTFLFSCLILGLSIYVCMQLYIYIVPDKVRNIQQERAYLNKCMGHTT